MAYLLGAIALSALLAWLVVWWHRRPKSMAKGINEFYEARQAIAPRPGEVATRPSRPDQPEGASADDDDEPPGGARRPHRR